MKALASSRNFVKWTLPSKSNLFCARCGNTSSRKSSMPTYGETPKLSNSGSQLPSSKCTPPWLNNTQLRVSNRTGASLISATSISSHRECSSQAKSPSSSSPAARKKCMSIEMRKQTNSRPGWRIKSNLSRMLLG